jgi:hypothetical protein
VSEAICWKCGQPADAEQHAADTHQWLRHDFAPEPGQEAQQLAEATWYDVNDLDDYAAELQKLIDQRDTAIRALQPWIERVNEVLDDYAAELQKLIDQRDTAIRALQPWIERVNEVLASVHPGRARILEILHFSLVFFVCKGTRNIRIEVVGDS